MSRHTSMTAMYAVEIPNKIAGKIYDNHFNDNFMAFSMNAKKLDNMTDDELDAELSGINAEDSNYPGHNKSDHIIFELMMLTHSEDLYKEVDIFYDEDESIPHYFGITIAQTAYGDKIGKFAGATPTEVIDNYKKYAKPIVDKYGITATPEFVVVQHTG